MKIFSALLLPFFLLVGMSASFAGASSSAANLTFPSVVEEAANPATATESAPMTKKEMKHALKDKASGERSWLVALILVIFFGVLGIHRFYLGYPIWGLIFLFTGGFFGIGWILDLIRILISNLKPKGGSYRY